MSKFGTEGEDLIGRWSEEKLNILQEYLPAYSVIMNKQKERWLQAYYYIDAFAGSVKPRAKEDEKRYIKGSPLRALQTEPQFDAYWFIDIDERRVERIEKLGEQFPNRIINIRQGDCNQILNQEIIPQIPYNSCKRAFVFLDPYGLQVEWETVKKLADTKTCDIFVNFSVMGVTRLLPKDNVPNQDVKEKINKIMGGADWIEQIYQPPAQQQLSLFEDPEPMLSRKKIETEWLAKLYTENLRHLFPHVSEPVIMKNSTNSPLYALCLGSHNEKAVKITNDIFKKYERLRQLES